MLPVVFNFQNSTVVCWNGRQRCPAECVAPSLTVLSQCVSISRTVESSAATGFRAGARFKKVKKLDAITLLDHRLPTFSLINTVRILRFNANPVLLCHRNDISFTRESSQF